MLHPATPSVIAARQEAVRELGQLPDWRHAFRALGMANPSSLRHQEQLQRWLDQEPVFRFRKVMSWALILLPLMTATAFAVTLFRGEPWWVSAACLLPSALLTGYYTKRVQRIHEATARTGAMLQAYAALLRHIETQPFESSLLQTLQTAIHTPRISASRALKQLGYLIDQLDVRYNPFAILLNLFGLWDLQWVYRLENWKTEWNPVLAGWFHTLAQFEALSSLGNLHFNNPGWTFPRVEEGLSFQSKGLGHPLIPEGRRVGNDLGMPVRAHLKLITGSNMAGKSTFLRSAGVNIVLAQSGAPVCAQAMELPPLQVYTSMRTQDALAENASSFYAELRRLKTLIETAKSSQTGPIPVFFLLDEILKGTNSRDRHQGAAALIRQLIRLQSAGLIATHDLELASMEAESQGHIENWYIDVQLLDGQLVFDYQLKKGVSQSFNATRLMAEMGIEV
ncbi:MAG: DNA mismatch repair protein MutS [Haliscomenobacter sp.]|nr:DNA mismatch repair protein MutS [Haliscomenobacter sp.]